MKYIRSYYTTEKSQKLFESLKSARTKYPNVPEAILKQFMTVDKSGTYKFVEKMCQFFTEGINFTIISHIMTEYQSLETYVLDKDITHKTYDDILSDIEDAKIRKLNSLSQRRAIARAVGLIYDKNNIKVYHITSFDEAKDKGKSTKWCTSLNEKTFDVWTSSYNMYIIVDKNKDLNSELRKVCYLNDGENDTFVTSENVHYFKENPEYDELKSYYGEEIMKLMI